MTGDANERDEQRIKDEFAPKYLGRSITQRFCAKCGAELR